MSGTLKPKQALPIKIIDVLSIGCRRRVFGKVGALFQRHRQPFRQIQSIMQVPDRFFVFVGTQQHILHLAGEDSKRRFAVFFTGIAAHAKAASDNQAESVADSNAGKRFSLHHQWPIITNMDSYRRWLAMDIALV